MKYIFILLVLLTALPVASAEQDSNGSLAIQVESPNSSLAATNGTRPASASPGSVSPLEYRDTNDSSMHHGRTAVADFRPSSIAVHDWFNVYNPSNEPYMGTIPIAVPQGAEVTKVANGSGATLKYSFGEGGVDVENISIPSGGSLLIGVHYDVRGNSLDLTSDRYTEDMALLMRAAGASSDQFALNGPLEMQGSMENQDQGRPEFLATAEKIESGVELEAVFEPSPKPVREGRGNESPSDIYLAVGVALAMITLLVYSVKGDLGSSGSLLPSMRGGSPSIGRGGKRFCPECGACSAGDFCSSCGAEVKATCRGCGADLDPGANFCGRCGEPVAGDESEVAT